MTASSDGRQLRQGSRQVGELIELLGCDQAGQVIDLCVFESVAQVFGLRGPVNELVIERRWGGK